MPIDIDSLTEEELRDLNYRIVERLRLIRQMHAHKAMMQFSIGDCVAFNADGRRITGVISRYNRKTVTVIADEGERWNVSPGLLTKADGRAVDRRNASVVVTPATRPAPNRALPTPQDRS
jgi:ribosomal protein S17